MQGCPIEHEELTCSVFLVHYMRTLATFHRVSTNSLFGSNICLFSLTVAQTIGSCNLPEEVQSFENRSISFAKG